MLFNSDVFYAPVMAFSTLATYLQKCFSILWQLFYSAVQAFQHLQHINMKSSYGVRYATSAVQSGSIVKILRINITRNHVFFSKKPPPRCHQEAYCRRRPLPPTRAACDPPRKVSSAQPGIINHE